MHILTSTAKILLNFNYSCRMQPAFSTSDSSSDVLLLSKVRKFHGSRLVPSFDLLWAFDWLRQIKWGKRGSPHRSRPLVPSFWPIYLASDWLWLWNEETGGPLPGGDRSPHGSRLPVPSFQRHVIWLSQSDVPKSPWLLVKGLCTNLNFNCKDLFFSRLHMFMNACNWNQQYNFSIQN